MTMSNIADIFTQETLNTLFPTDLSNQFFDALYGDAEEGAYDIRLVFKGLDNGNLNFEFQLDQRPGKCLACNLTYGLPDVFSRHPILNIDQLVQKINTLLNENGTCTSWKLGSTREISQHRHVIPLLVYMTT